MRCRFFFPLPYSFGGEKRKENDFAKPGAGILTCFSFAEDKR